MRIIDLQLADVVRRDGSSAEAYVTMTVKQIEKDWVTFFRPFVHTGDFSCTSGVLCYVGIEEFKVCKSENVEYILLERRQLK